MLKQLSRLERTRNFLILAFVAVLALSLVLFFRPGGDAGRVDPTKSTEVLAVVGGEEITVGDFTLQKQNLQQQFARFGSQISLARMGYSDEKILDGLIASRVTSQEAERLGLGGDTHARGLVVLREAEEEAVILAAQVERRHALARAAEDLEARAGAAGRARSPGCGSPP